MRLISTGIVVRRPHRGFDRIGRRGLELFENGRWIADRMLGVEQEPVVAAGGEGSAVKPEGSVTQRPICWRPAAMAALKRFFGSSMSVSLGRMVAGVQLAAVMVSGPISAPLSLAERRMASMTARLLEPLEARHEGRFVAAR